MKIKLEKRDKLLIVIVVCVALCAFLAHQIIGGDGAGKVTVKVNGELKGTYSLAEDQTIEINGGTNILQIKNGKADMTEADCPDQLCVNQRAISRQGESIICLPHKLVSRTDSAAHGCRHSESSELDAVTN